MKGRRERIRRGEDLGELEALGEAVLVLGDFDTREGEGAEHLLVGQRVAVWGEVREEGRRGGLQKSRPVMGVVGSALRCIILKMKVELTQRE